MAPAGSTFYSFFFVIYTFTANISLASSFSLDVSTTLSPLIHDATTAISPFIHETSTLNVASSAVPATTTNTIAFLRGGGADLFLRYKQTLSAHPLETKMITGGVLAIVGDAIAQFQTKDGEEVISYDTRRAISFVAFDMCYRALQQVSFPGIAQSCRGDFLLKGVQSIPPLANTLTSSVATTGHDLQHYLSAFEQTCAFQFLIVPFLYYPVFFALTGVVQGLTTTQSIDRAKQSFLPLMKRNLLFWIPVQFITFAFIEGDLQIPLLCVSGLLWTIILSVSAGSATKYSSDGEEELETLLSEIDPDYVSSEDIDTARGAALKRVPTRFFKDAKKKREVVDNVTARAR